MLNKENMSNKEEMAKLVERNVSDIAKNRDFLDLTNAWLREAIRHSYAYNFSWLGRPIIQIPQDIYAVQEIIWRVRPNLVIETGVAHGGSLMLSASMLALLDYCDASAMKRPLDPQDTKRRVVGIDIDIRHHNRDAIERHPLAHLIEMIEGSSIDTGVVQRVRNIASDYDRVLVFLDSNHTHEHVLAELEAYAPLIAVGSYCVVWDTGIEDLPAEFCVDRFWGKGNNPKTAVHEYLRRLSNEGRTGFDGAPLKLEVDNIIESKVAITAGPDGYLRRVK